MLNLDKIKQQKNDMLSAMSQAIKDNDEVALQTAMSNWSDFMQEQVTAEAKGMLDAMDTAVLTQRGVRQLTKKETEFYNGIINHARMDAQTVITGLSNDLPETVIASVFDNIRRSHPLLDKIGFMNTTALTKIIVNTKGAQTAVWGDLNSTITKDLEGSIAAISTTLCKLTAYMFVTMDMVDLGPQWLDKYVRETLSEAIATGLETGIVDGTGKSQPIGMTRDVSDDVVIASGVYPRKAATVVKHLDPETYGTLLATLATDPNGNTRAVDRVILLTNPADYFAKLMPATTMQLQDGSYKNDLFPFPTDSMMSVAIPQGYAVIGIASKYFMGLGSSKEGKMEYSDEFKYLDDLRTYKAKLYGTGRAMDDNAFLYLDISGLEKKNPVVETLDHENADLVSLSVGALTLTPAFDRDTTSYTATATAASNTITATAKDGDATIAILNGEASVTNGGSATWTDNAVNTVTATVTNGGTTKTYTIAVTKGTPA